MKMLSKSCVMTLLLIGTLAGCSCTCPPQNAPAPNTTIIHERPTNDY